MPRYSLRRLIVIVAIAAFIGAAYAYINRSPLINLFGGEHNLRIVGSSTQVEAYRLTDPTDGRTLGGHELPPSPTEYRIGDGPVALTPELVAEVAKALTATHTYDWSTAKDCWPIYGFKLSFLNAADRVDVYFCFECDILTIVHDGQEVGSEDFDYARPVFVRAAKRSFPDDDVIQSLSE